MISAKWNIGNGDIVTGSGDAVVITKRVSEEKTANALLNRYESMSRELFDLRAALSEAGVYVGEHSCTWYVQSCPVGKEKTKRFTTAREAYAFAFDYIKTGEWD